MVSRDRNRTTARAALTLVALLLTGCALMSPRCRLDEATAEKTSEAYRQGLAGRYWSRETLDANPGLREMLSATSAGMLSGNFNQASIPCLRPPRPAALTPS